MLERPGLILGPWQWTDARKDLPSGGRSRLILDAADRQFLGRVKSRRASHWPIVRRFCREIWEVMETEDESLLLSVYCPWGWIKPWEIFDAEGNLVCILHQDRLFDSRGKVRARVTSGQSNNERRFLGTDGAELGRMRGRDRDIELTFAKAVASDPFAKMALLGASLTYQFPSKSD